MHDSDRVNIDMCDTTGFTDDDLTFSHSSTSDDTDKENGGTCWQGTVTAEEAGQRLDAYLSVAIPEISRSYAQQLLSDGLVSVNGKKPKASLKLKAGDQVLCQIPAPSVPDILPENIPLDILYEDDDLLVVNKPKGMVVHPAAGHLSGTLVNALMYHCGDSLSGINGILRPGILHRIDMNTTGSLLVAKHDEAHRILAQQLKEHSITRRYRAIVCGNIKEDSGTVDAPIGRHPIDRKKMAIKRQNGKEAVTHFQVLERFGNYTLIECRLETGRTHQIRVHMSSLHHPVLGDDVYGPEKCPWKLQGQTLHAAVLGFDHPRTGAYMEFEAPLPEYFEKLLTELRRRTR